MLDEKLLLPWPIWNKKNTIIRCKVKIWVKKSNCLWVYCKWCLESQSMWDENQNYDIIFTILLVLYQEKSTQLCLFSIKFDLWGILGLLTKYDTFHFLTLKYDTVLCFVCIFCFMRGNYVSFTHKEASYFHLCSHFLNLNQQLIFLTAEAFKRLWIYVNHNKRNRVNDVYFDERRVNINHILTHLNTRWSSAYRDSLYFLT